MPDVAENRINELIIENFDQFTIGNKNNIESILLGDRHPATEFYKAGLFTICLMAMSNFINNEEVKELGDNVKDIFIKIENKKQK